MDQILVRPNESRPLKAGALERPITITPGQVSASKERTARWLEQALEDLTGMKASRQQLNRYIADVLGDMKMLVQSMTQMQASPLWLKGKPKNLIPEDIP